MDATLYHLVRATWKTPRNSEAKEKLEPRPRVFRLACMWQQTGVARRQLTYAPKSPPKGSPVPLNAPLSPGKPLKG